MLAMLVLDLDSETLFIPHHDDTKLVLVKSDAAAEKYLLTNYLNCRLLGTLPDPTHLIKIVLKERDDAKKTKDTKVKKR